jgi:hypothetical protein
MPVQEVEGDVRQQGRKHAPCNAHEIVYLFNAEPAGDGINDLMARGRCVAVCGRSPARVECAVNLESSLAPRWAQEEVCEPRRIRRRRLRFRRKRGFSRCARVSRPRTTPDRRSPGSTCAWRPSVGLSAGSGDPRRARLTSESQRRKS